MSTSSNPASPSNRLVHEASPYLLQHAQNPVDWHPWGPEALSKSRVEDKPILLSIGYSACHWCHVMERESFENEAIAARMNELFVNVKVDREERPDLDHIYQLVVQLMGRSGGWPLTVFLTPDQKPFFGGTYFPPVDKYGMPGFPKILEAVADAYRTRSSDVALQADEIARAIADATKTDEHAPYTPGPDLLERAAKKLGARFDDLHGGFGSRPKFPNSMPLEVLLRRASLEKDDEAARRVDQALSAMRAGGIYDQLGEGFHRYSTDELWLVPHFEKMLYDNALLVRLYADAYRALGGDEHAETARGIARYVAREMTQADGAFFASQDADSEGEEGKFFVWTPTQIAHVLEGDDEAIAVATRVFGVTPQGNFEGSGATVLHLSKAASDVAVRLGIAPSAVAAALDRAKEKLLAARERREKPFRDEKIIASWNALLIGALAHAGATLGDTETGQAGERMISAARKAYAFVRGHLVARGAEGLRVTRIMKGDRKQGVGFLDDYAYLADAALDLYEVTGEPAYVADARGLADAIVSLFSDEAAPGFFFTPKDGEALIVRVKDPFDQAVPSGASIASKAMLRLGALVGGSYAAIAERAATSLAAAAVATPFGMGQTIGVLDRLVRGSVDVVLVGPRGDERTHALAHAALTTYLPNRTIAWLDPKDPSSRAACSALAEGKEAREAPVAYVCRGRVCSLPIATADELRAALEG